MITAFFQSVFCSGTRDIPRERAITQKYLVLDLDETLVLAKQSPMDSVDFTMEVKKTLFPFG